MNWCDYKKVKIESLLENTTWTDFFDKNQKEINNINTFLTEKKKLSILPKPDLLFFSFNNLDLKNVKVVILGQDPYFNIRNGIEEAMGLSFSVPPDVPIPSSLRNIFYNQLENNIIDEIPKSGELTSWLVQGCFMINTAFTVEEGKKNSHSKIWEKFSDNLIKYLSDKLDFCIFVLWGAYAEKKKTLIDSSKHKLIISSHPSGLSFTKGFANYPAFKKVNHFGLINKYLKENNDEEIIWNLE